MKIGSLHSASALLFCLLASLTAAGQATRPSARPVDTATGQVLESEPLRIAGAPANGARPSTIEASGSSEMIHIAIALAVVIGVILLLRTAVRQMASMPGTARSGKLVTVLSRSVISPRQQVLVLQVGKRLLVVSDSAGAMNPLCEITDPDEVALLVGQGAQAKSAVAERAAGSFRSLFGRANQPFEEVDAMQPGPGEIIRVVEPDEGVSSEEVRGLLDKVRMLQKQFKT